MALFILLLLLAAGAYDVTQSQNARVIAIAAKQAGFTGGNAIIAVAVALAESGGNLSAQGDLNLPIAGRYNAFGPWQVNIGENPQFDENSLITSLAYSANAAASIHAQQGWSAWSTYKSGKYIAFLPIAAAAVAGSDTGVSL